MLDFSVLLGKTLVGVTGGVGSDEIVFIVSDSEKYCLYHSQDCCESVTVEDVIGDLEDLVGSPILMAEEVCCENCVNPNEIEPEKRLEGGCSNSFTWTFYKLATVKGYVTIRWLGQSDGYYSESVDFKQIKSREEYSPYRNLPSTFAASSVNCSG